MHCDSTVVDWNELDYVELTGATALPEGVLATGEELLYVPDPENACGYLSARMNIINRYIPDPDQSGSDSFEYTMSDCLFHTWRQPTQERQNRIFLKRMFIGCLGHRSVSTLQLLRSMMHRSRRT